MNLKETCMRILAAESESAVSEIIASTPEMANPSNWRPIDGRDTNFNVVTNQASTGSKALTELCTNMVDAMLLKHAYLKNIDPTGADAPKSVIAGVRDLVRLDGARSGVLAEVDDQRYLQKFAEENLVIGVTGGTRRGQSLCFTFVDNGEGQHPRDFEDTFLSLSKGNKSSIPFVQGKYNMGSSGVLTYCGRRWYKLIVSRRYDSSGDWGWTLVRRRPGDGMPVAEYFKPCDGIPSFGESNLRPLRLQTGEADDKVSISTGAVVKLYDYQMETASSFRHIRESLQQNLISTVLPFRLMDYTVRPQRTGRRAQGVDERGLYGMEFLLLHRYGYDSSQDDDHLDGEPGSEQHIGDIDHPDLGRISARAIVLKKDIPGWLKPPRNTSRVFHSVNGQVQYKQNRAYLSQRCKLPGLKDRVVIIVDASELLESAHNDVWKGDRENIRATATGNLYTDEVTNLISNSEFLKNLQRKIAREETENIADTSRVDLFQDLVNNDPSIAQLLPDGVLVKLNVLRPVIKPPVEYEGKYSPTFLEVVASAIRRNGAEIEVNGKRRVVFRTDVVNDYLTRPDNRGRVFTVGDLSGKCSYTASLRDGQLSITFAALENRVSVGDEITFSVAMLDDAMPEPVSAELKLVVVEYRKPSRSGGKPRNGDVTDEISEEGRGLPPTKWLTANGRMIGDEETERWPEDFTDQDGGKVDDLGESERLYCINYDNAHFQQFLNRERNEVDKKVVTEQYRLAMLVLMLGVEDAFARMEQGVLKTALEEHIDEIRRLAANGAATVVMSIAKTLSQIVNPASVADPDD